MSYITSPPLTSPPEETPDDGALNIEILTGQILNRIGELEQTVNSLKARIPEKTDFKERAKIEYLIKDKLKELYRRIFLRRVAKLSAQIIIFLFGIFTFYVLKMESASISVSTKIDLSTGLCVLAVSAALIYIAVYFKKTEKKILFLIIPILSCTAAIYILKSDDDNIISPWRVDMSAGLSVFAALSAFFIGLFFDGAIAENIENNVKELERLNADFIDPEMKNEDARTRYLNICGNI